MKHSPANSEDTENCFRRRQSCSVQQACRVSGVRQRRQTVKNRTALKHKLLIKLRLKLQVSVSFPLRPHPSPPRLPHSVSLSFGVSEQVYFSARRGCASSSAPSNSRMGPWQRSACQSGGAADGLLCPHPPPVLLSCLVLSFQILFISTSVPLKKLHSSPAVL